VIRRSRRSRPDPISDQVLTPFDEHAIGLMDILVRWPGKEDWELVAEWLAVAGSLDQVTLNSTKLNPDFGWCSQADEFDASREELLTSFVRELTLLSFCWGALEAALKIIDPPRQSPPAKRGRIREACYFLRESFTSHTAVVGLDREVSRFRNAARECLGIDRVEGRFKLEPEFGSQAIGLYAVYELRNDFAHGSLAFPMPDEENRPISEHAAMIQSASRIILMQLQMLLLAFSGESKINVPGLGFHLRGFEDEDVPLNLALRSCHLANATNEFQLPLALGD
jgi:hypothetical protein